MSQTDKLIHMANQIALNFAVKGEHGAIAATATHVQKFWDPSMRADITSHINKCDGEGLSPVALQALQLVAKD